MPQAPSSSLKPLEEFLQTMKMVGHKRTIAALQNARQSGDPTQLHISFITELICESFSTTLEKIKEGKERQDITYARGFIVFYLRNDFNIAWKELKELLDRDQSNLYLCSKVIKQLDPRLAPHKTYCLKKELFDEKIKHYCKQLKK